VGVEICPSPLTWPLAYTAGSTTLQAVTRRLQNNLVAMNKRKNKLECGPMPNVMAALPNIGGALSAQRHKVWLTLTTRMPCSNAANIG